MARELTFNITEDRRRLVEPTNVEGFEITFDRDIISGSKNWVDGRIGENAARQVFVNVKYGPNNEPYDLTGIIPEFCGLTAKGGPENRNYSIIDNWHSVMIDAQGGRFRFDFPKDAFVVAGSYKQAFFNLKREGSGDVVATLEFDMRVMSNFVYSNIVPKDFITPYIEVLDRLINEFKQGNVQKEELISELQKTVQNKLDIIEATFKSTNDTLESLKSTANYLSDKIEQNGLFTQGEARNVAIVKKNSVEDMISDGNLIEKCVVQTSGYYTPGDGGDALYYISSAVPNNSHYESLKNGLYAKLLNNDKVNIKQLGAIEDSNNDVSQIINDNTQFYELYVPSGNFYAKNTIKLTNSLTGVADGRRPTSKIISQLDEGKLIDGTNLNNNAKIYGLTFSSNNEDETVSITLNSYKNLSIENIGIENLSNVGLRVNDTSGTSRAIYISGVTVFGNFKKAVNSVAIQIDKAFDSRIENLELMGCQVGVRLTDTFIYGTNWHVWCGSLFGQDTTWQDQTKIFRFKNSRLYGSQIYTDSAHDHFYFEDKLSLANITNLISMNDPNAVSALTISNLVSGINERQLVVSGGQLFIDSKFTNFSSGKFNNVSINLRISLDDYMNRINSLGYDSLVTTDNFDANYLVKIPTVTDSQVTLVARLSKKPWTSTHFTIHNLNESSFEINASWDGKKLIISKKSVGPNSLTLFYKINDNTIDIYSLSSSGTSWIVSADSNYYSALIAIKPEQVTTDIGSVTEIPEQQYSVEGSYLNFRLDNQSPVFIVYNDNVGLIRFDGSKVIVTNIVGNLSGLSFLADSTHRSFRVNASAPGVLKIIN